MPFGHNELPNRSATGLSGAADRYGVAKMDRVRQFEALERSRRIDALELLSRSTDRLSRQNRIREMVGKSDERPNISALARQFKVARRTIIRDLQELIRRGEIKPEVYPEWEDDQEQE